MENKTKVDVYWNINKKCFSIKDCKTGKVTGYTDAIRLVKAQFIVRKAGRDRVIREQQKNVHAFVRGYIEAKATITPTSEIRGASYNPYKRGSFYDKQTEQPVEQASVVELYTNDRNRGDISYVSQLRTHYSWKQRLPNPQWKYVQPLQRNQCLTPPWEFDITKVM